MNKVSRGLLQSPPSHKDTRTIPQLRHERPIQNYFQFKTVPLSTHILHNVFPYEEGGGKLNPLL